MACVECGNCKSDEQVYYCIAQNDFVVREKVVTLEEKARSGWKKGESGYEKHRRQNRKMQDIV